MDTEATTDALIIGAGPAGLYQAFQLGLQGISCQLVDSLAHPGGQCVQLYADKPIYDIPGLPVCSGRGLVQRLVEQIRPFGTPMHLGQEVQSLGHDGVWQATTSSGLRLRARCVVIAAGMGAFVPRRLKVAGVEDVQELLHHPAPATLAGRPLPTLVLGGDEGAVAAAVAVAQSGAPCWLMHRRDVFSAPPALLLQLQEMRAAGRIGVLAGQITRLHGQDGALQAVQWVDHQGQEQSLGRAQRLVVCQGIAPSLASLLAWGLPTERKLLVVDAATLATGFPGVYAIGDIVHYPGKQKLIVCAFHEATLAAFAVYECLHGKKPLLQYTTTHKALHALLGVA